MTASAPARTLLEAGYVLTVTAVAGWGFLTDSTAAILVAVVLTLPSGLLAMVCFYAAYGLLAQVPGANPSSSSGYAHCSPSGSCTEWSTGGLAPWFEHTTDLIGILALTSAACANVALVRFASSRRAQASIG